MRSHYKDKYFTTFQDIKKAVKAECDANINAVYEEDKKDVASQIMAVCCMELNKEFGYGKKRLNKFYRGVNDLFKLMATDGILGKEFTPINCIEVLRDKYGIDLDEKRP